MEAREVVRLFRETVEQGRDPWSVDAERMKPLDRAVRLALQALSILQQEHDSEPTLVTTVATTPRTALRARRIASVVKELLTGARTEIIVLGYELSDRRVRDHLARASAAGAQVSLLLDSVQSPVEPLVRALGALLDAPATLAKQ
jgi:phosphatidylserine/phosphatidylglycerophosphate/cardiolipin synthase-like enzyme